MQNHYYRPRITVQLSPIQWTTYPSTSYYLHYP